MDSCVLYTSLIEAVVFLAGIIALADVAFREIPSTLIKFRVHFVINILVTQIYYSSLGIENSEGAEIFLAWLTFLRSATGFVVVLYILENFVRVLFVVADIGQTNSMDIASPLLQCWAVYRVFIVAFNIIIGIVFSVTPINGIFIAHVAGNIFSVTFAIFPVCIVLTRLAYLIRQHQKQISQQEQKYIDEFEPKQRLSDSEDVEAQKKSKKSHKKNSPSRSHHEVNSMQRTQDKSKIKRTERQLAVFVALVMICVIAWNYDNITEMQTYVADITGRWTRITCAIGFGQILHVVTSLVSLVITRAPNARKRKWTTTSPMVTTIGRVFSQVSRSQDKSQDKQLGSQEMQSADTYTKRGGKAHGHFRSPSGHIGSVRDCQQQQQLNSGFSSAATSRVGSAFNSPVSSRMTSPVSSPRHSNADQFPPPSSMSQQDPEFCPLTPVVAQSV